MHQLVGALWRRGRRLQRPEHRDTQGERHDYGEGDVEVLAHATRLTAPGPEHKWKLLLGGFAAKVKGAPNQWVGGSDKVDFQEDDCSHAATAQAAPRQQSKKNDRLRLMASC